MGIMGVIALASKGFAIVSALIEAGQNAVPAIDAIKSIFSRDRTVPPTQEEMDKVEATLDAMLDEFNLELPPE